MMDSDLQCADTLHSTRFHSPTIYKNKKLNIYPFLMKDYDLFSKSVSLLMHNKDIYQEPSILEMSYLTFIITVLPVLKVNPKDYNDESQIRNKVNEESKSIQDTLSEMLSYITKSNNSVDFYTKIDEFGYRRSYFKLDDIEYSEFDFNNIKDIVLDINGIPKSNFNITSHRVQSAIDMAKSNSSDDMTVEERMISYHVATGIPFEVIDNYTVSLFNQCVNRLIIYEDYKLFKGLEASGQIKLENGKIQHYMSHIKPKGLYDDVLIESDQVVDKVNQVNSKTPINK